MATVVTVVSLLVVALAVPTVVSAVRIVEEGELYALLVFGQMRAVLGPGLHVVPPFVSSTHPIDPSTMTMDTGDDRVTVPAEYRDEVRDRSERWASP